MLNPVLVIERKRDGHALTSDEIRFLISGYAKGEIPDYQMSAWAMAVYLQGMNAEEIAVLTSAMIATGDRLNPVGDKPRVDKHSTGGLGDKVSLILAPLLACADVHVPMISGRGLGITGGTLDKLEAIPGYRTNLDEAAIEQQLREVGCVITGASDRIVPADKKLYALRDVTATVPSVALITASILSKKMAESLTGLILDVKFGSGAFMQTETEARILAESLVSTGNLLGLPTSALLSDMTQPLGKMVGNANEVVESRETLKGGGPADVRILTLELSARLLVDIRASLDIDSARQSLEQILDSGRAFEQFERMVTAQGGRLDAMPKLGKSHDLTAKASGFLQSIDGQRLGHAVIALGGGRKFVGQAIDPSVGLEMLVRVGDKIQTGQPLVRVFSGEKSDRASAMRLLDDAFTVGDTALPPVLLFQPWSK
ncbi:MAG: thymidine phosphorylase [Pirellulaceae bacterium]|nr:thymidine phosphorylase [Pirellulaceae bacterium]